MFFDYVLKEPDQKEYRNVSVESAKYVLKKFYSYLQFLGVVFLHGSGFVADPVRT